MSGCTKRRESNTRYPSAAVSELDKSLGGDTPPIESDNPLVHPNNVNSTTSAQTCLGCQALHSNRQKCRLVLIYSKSIPANYEKNLHMLDWLFWQEFLPLSFLPRREKGFDRWSNEVVEHECAINEL
jgi:hypothetical protein